MKMFIFAILDSKVEAYLLPFFAANAMLALRSFERAAMNPDQTMHTHPEDFTLYQIGEYIEQTAEIVPQDPKSIINGRQLPFWNKETK